MTFVRNNLLVLFGVCMTIFVGDIFGGIAYLIMYPPGDAFVVTIFQGIMVIAAAAIMFIWIVAIKPRRKSES